jgi:lipopolysaccharide transport system ATP-binding protein
MRGIHDSGKTVLVVSHNMSTIAGLCQSVIWLKDGQLAAHGPTGQVLGRYLSEGMHNDLVWTPREPRDTALEIHSVSVVAGNGAESSEAFAADTPIDVVFDFTIHEWFPPAHLEVRLMNDVGEVLLTSSSADGVGQASHDWQSGRQTYRCRIPGNFLAPGRYFVSILEPVITHERLRMNVVSFAVSEQNSLLGQGERQGKIAPLLEWVKRPANG